MRGSELRQRIDRDVFDYTALTVALSGYANPRNQIRVLLQRTDIIRVKKGLYVFGPQLRRGPICRELLANLIHGPSIVSLEYALSFHQMIPERVVDITSSTYTRARLFNTPLGTFSYHHAPKDYFSLGIDRREGDQAFLIAVPERALADKLRHDRGHPMRSLEAMSAYLFADLRLDQVALQQLDLGLLSQLAEAAHSQKIALCVRLLTRMQTRTQRAAR